MLAGDLVALVATAASPVEVRVDYAVTGTIAEPTATLAVYRSADPVFDATDTRVGQTSLAGAGLAAGSHSVELAVADSLGAESALRFQLDVVSGSSAAAPAKAAPPAKAAASDEDEAADELDEVDESEGSDE